MPRRPLASTPGRLAASLLALALAGAAPAMAQDQPAEEGNGGENGGGDASLSRLDRALDKLLAGGADAGDSLAELGDKLADKPVFSLSAAASQRVPRDRLHLRLAAQHEAGQPAAAIDAVNAQTEKALAILPDADAADVDVSTQGYDTRQDREAGTWRARQTIRVESTRPEILDLTDELVAAGLVIDGLSYRVSPAERRAAETALIGDVMARLKERAQAMAAALGYSCHRMLSVELGRPGGDGPRPQAGRMALAESGGGRAAQGRGGATAVTLQAHARARAGCP